MFEFLPRHGPTTDLLEALSGFRVFLRRAKRQREEGESRGEERSGLPEIYIVFFSRVWVLSCWEAGRGKRREKKEKARFGVRLQLVSTLSVDAAHERTREGVGGVR